MYSSTSTSILMKQQCEAFASDDLDLFHHYLGVNSYAVPDHRKIIVQIIRLGIWTYLESKVALVYWVLKQQTKGCNNSLIEAAIRHALTHNNKQQHAMRHSTLGRMIMESTSIIHGHLLVLLLICSPCSLICLLCTASLARALCFTCSLAK